MTWCRKFVIRNVLIFVVWRRLTLKVGVRFLILMVSTRVIVKVVLVWTVVKAPPEIGNAMVLILRVRLVFGNRCKLNGRR